MTRDLAGPDSRAELIGIQRDLVERLKREINRRLGYQGPALESYYREYRRDVNGYRRVATLWELVGRVLGADVVYQGDYHTLALSQQTALSILEEVVKVRPAVTIAVESVCQEFQEALDAWLARTLTDEEFLEGIDYENAWGFDWNSHRRVLDFARERGLPVVGINTDPHDRGRRIRDRDRAAAEVIARAMLASPGRLLYAVVGDLHVCPSHLPRHVERILRRHDARRAACRRLIVYQNVEAIYWQLAGQGLEQTTEVVEVADDTYCVVSATPLVRLQSYFSWAEGLVDLPVYSRLDTHGRDPDAHDVHDMFRHIARTIAGFFELDADVDDFTLYTSADLDFLSVLRRGRGFSADEVETIARQIARNESYFIPGHNIVYLATPSLNHAAEEAAHFVHAACAGHQEGPVLAREEFYQRAMREAVGFVGSKVINQKREAPDGATFEGLLRDFGRRRKLTDEERTLKAVARGVLRHREAERLAFRSDGRPLSLPSLYHADLDVYLGVTTCLGYMLGGKVYDALVAGRMPKAEVSGLFREPFTGQGRAYRAYMDLAKRFAEEEARAAGASGPAAPSPSL